MIRLFQHSRLWVPMQALLPRPSQVPLLHLMLKLHASTAQQLQQSLHHLEHLQQLLWHLWHLLMRQAWQLPRQSWHLTVQL